MNKNIIILVLLIFAIFLLNYSFLDSLLISFLDLDYKIFIERVIDGDTVVSNGTSIRLLGINCPEKGELYSEEATKFLSYMVLNKSIKVKITGKDKYYRDLGYLFIDSKNINLELVRNGFANFYFPSGKDGYYEEFLKAWEECLEKEKNLCLRSRKYCSGCIELLEWDIKKQEIILINKCEVACDLSGWSIKDEGRKKFIFKNFTLDSNARVNIILGNNVDSKNTLYWKNEKYVWTQTGDSIFIRDKLGNLVLFENY